jgi:hypothetical protein
MLFITSVPVINLFFSILGSPWIRAVVNAGVIVAFRAILPAVAVALIIYAIYKMVLFIRHQGHQFNVPQVSLALEIIANLRKYQASVFSANLTKYLAETAFVT